MKANAASAKNVITGSSPSAQIGTTTSAAANPGATVKVGHVARNRARTEPHAPRPKVQRQVEITDLRLRNVPVMCVRLVRRLVGLDGCEVRLCVIRVPVRAPVCPVCVPHVCAPAPHGFFEPPDRSASKEKPFHEFQHVIGFPNSRGPTTEASPPNPFLPIEIHHADHAQIARLNPIEIRVTGGLAVVP